VFTKENAVHQMAEDATSSHNDRRRERRFEQTRDEIVASAREVMMETGAARL